MAIIVWNKKYTETLAQTLVCFHEVYPEYREQKVTYAGRLDPLAEGLLVLLTGSDVHKKEFFLDLDKTYTVSFMFGATTDTYDVLGIAAHESDNVLAQDIVKKTIHENLLQITQQTYPAYSSKAVNGKPLFVWAREGLLDTITIPVRDMSIYDVQYEGEQVISKKDLQKQIFETVNGVEGDFRQTEIHESWGTYFSQAQKSEYKIHTMTVSCSSGTYVRTLVNTLGQLLGIGACSVKIQRTQIGEYTTDDLGLIEYPEA